MFKHTHKHTHTHMQDKTVFLQIHNANLRWLDPETSTPTLTQPINKIRVWGIGLENDKDFGYVARNLNTKKYQCHIFRCERPARAVARALLEAHQRERQQKRARKALQKEESVTSSGEQTTGEEACQLLQWSPCSCVLYTWVCIHIQLTIRGLFFRLVL